MKLRRDPATRLTPLDPNKNPSGNHSTPKDVKNEGRSGNVYENKWSRDKMPEKMSDICARSAAFSQIISDFDRQFAGNCTLGTRFLRSCANQAREPIQPFSPSARRAARPGVAVPLPSPPAMPIDIHLDPFARATPTSGRGPQGSAQMADMSKMKVHPAICMKTQSGRKAINTLVSSPPESPQERKMSKMKEPPGMCMKTKQGREGSAAVCGIRTSCGND